VISPVCTAQYASISTLGLLNAVCGQTRLPRNVKLLWEAGHPDSGRNTGNPEGITSSAGLVRRNAAVSDFPAPDYVTPVHWPTFRYRSLCTFALITNSLNCLRYVSA
jgi:hypothetical protein